MYACPSHVLAYIFAQRHVIVYIVNLCHKSAQPTSRHCTRNVMPGILTVQLNSGSAPPVTDRPTGGNITGCGAGIRARTCCYGRLVAAALLLPPSE